MNPAQKQFSLNRAASKKQIPISSFLGSSVWKLLRPGGGRHFALVLAVPDIILCAVLNADSFYPMKRRCSSERRAASVTPPPANSSALCQCHLSRLNTQ